MQCLSPDCTIMVLSFRTIISGYYINSDGSQKKLLVKLKIHQIR